MKRITNSRNKSPAHGLVAMLLGSALLVSVASAGYEEVLRAPGGASYVSGGVGTDSIDRLTLLAGDFNLKLVFALTSGAYVSAVRVIIADTTGKTLLDTTSDGPWLLARLPAGNYQVVATFEGKTVQRKVIVGAAKLRTVDFRWASEHAARP